MLCLGRSRGQKPRGLRPLGFWPWDLPRHNIHHDTSSAFSYNVPVHSIEYTVYSIHYTWENCTLYSVKYTFYSKECRVYIVHGKVYNRVQCTVHIVRSTVYRVSEYTLPQLPQASCSPLSVPALHDTQQIQD